VKGTRKFQLCLQFFPLSLFSKEAKMRLLVAFLLLPVLIQAQTPECGFDHLIQQNPEQNVRWNEAFRYAQSHMHQTNRQVVYEIPVVFHVVYNNDTQNLADSVILSQMEVLNEDYRRQNADAALTRDEFLPIAGDAEIEFVLADEDPWGNPTDGIDRVFTEQSGWSFSIFDISTLDEVKSSDAGGADAWDTDEYLNIWVCNIEGNILATIFGYAYPPEGLPNWPAGSSAPSPGLEGVVLHYPVVGRNNPHHLDDDFADNDLGRAASHEVGHYLGLRHIWGDGLFNGCTVDDGIEDTPNCASAANYSCDFSLNTCDEGDEDMPDNIENFMDYNADACVNMFTQEQIDMMRYVLETYRPSLIDGEITSVEERPFDTMALWPNPARNQVNVVGKNNNEVLSIRDLAGNVVDSRVISKGNNIVKIDDLTPGLYFVQVEGGTAMRLIVI
jgi:hypothetical protein